MESLLVSTFVVALAEIGDKTQLLAIVLATRFRKPLPIIAGILCATLANHALAALAGFFLTDFLSGVWFKYALALSFIAMAIWALVPDKVDELKENRAGASVFVTTLIAFFLVEIGDKTQVATTALAARFHDVAWVTAGTTLGMMLANVPAVLLGEAATRVVPLKYVRLGAALIFLALGLSALAEAAGMLERFAAWSLSTDGTVALALAALLSLNALGYALRAGEQLREPARDALRLAAPLALLKFLAPCAGWALGFAVSSVLEPIDHWIAFCLLAALGVFTIVMSLRRSGEQEISSRRFKEACVYNAVILSFDALMVGIILGLLNEQVAGTAIIAGVLSFLTAMLGVWAARHAPLNRRNYPEFLSGIFLMVAGGVILFTHLSGV